MEGVAICRSDGGDLPNPGTRNISTVPQFSSVCKFVALHQAKCPNVDGALKSCGLVGDALYLLFNARGDGEKKNCCETRTKCGFDDAGGGGFSR